MDKQTTGDAEQDRTLVDRITYLASLTSESKVIDPMLDPLRAITARWRNTEPLGKADHLKLKSLEKELKEFLTTKDPLRSFSDEDLEDRIRIRETAPSRFNNYPTAVLASFVVAGLVYLIPSRSMTLEHKNLTAACTQMLAGQLITVWFYLSNLNNFKKEFRQAFVLLSIGILPLGVLFGQIGLVQILGIGEAEPFQYAGVSYFATAAFVIMYLGLRKYALLLQIKTKVSSLASIFSLSTLVAIAMVIVPHASKPKTELFFDISLAAITVAFIFTCANAALIYKIMRLVTSAYRKPLLILCIYMYASIFGTAVAAGALYLLGGLSVGNLALIILLVAMPQQLLLLYSGYQFERYIGR